MAPPSSGDVNNTVATQAPKVLPGVGLTRDVTVATGVRIRVVAIKSVQAVSRTPGEVNGPAVQVTVGIRNGTGRALNVGSASVGVTDSQGGPGVPVTTAASRAFTGSVKSGAEATGVYVFRVAVDRRNPITVAAKYTGAGRLARFVGAVK